MHLMYIPDPAHPTKRIYTLKKIIDGEVSKSAHPARFSPDDKYSRHRVTIKKRYGLLLTQQSMFCVLFWIRLWLFFLLNRGKYARLVLSERACANVCWVENKVAERS